MQKRNKLFYFLCVAIPVAALIFLTVSCEYIMDPDAPVWGEIVITSKSSETNSDAHRYFSATGVLNIEEGVVTDYEWEAEYTIEDDGIYYSAEAGYMDFTGEELPEVALPAQKGEDNKDIDDSDGWFSNLKTMLEYLERKWNYGEPIETPELTPDVDNIRYGYEFEWQDDKITGINKYRYFMLDRALFSRQLETPPDWITEFLYDSKGNLERTCRGVWNGEVVGYSYVNVFSDYDESGNPVKETIYSGPEYPAGEGITQYPENTAKAEVTEINFDVDWAGPTGNDYFFIYSNDTSYYVWYTITNEGTDPETPGYTGINVNLPSGYTYEDLINATANAIDSSGDFTALADVEFNTVTVTNVDNGNVTDALQGNTPLGINVTTQGFLPGMSSTEYTYDYDESGRLVSAPFDEYFRFDITYDENDSVKTLTFYDPDNEGVYDVTLTFMVPAGILYDTEDLVRWMDPIGNMIIQTLLPYYIMMYYPPVLAR